MDEISITDDRRNARFVLNHDPECGHLDYSERDGRLTLVHAEVAPQFRGRGYAGRLVRAAVERAARDGLTVVPACPYTRAWLDENPDVAERVEIEWPPRRRVAV